MCFFFCKQKAAYEMRISDWSSDVCSSDLAAAASAAALGKVDILVCSAGITGATAPVHEYPLDSWRRVIDLNLNGLFYCCRAVVPLMLAGGYGRIVNIASVAGTEGNPNASAYSTSNAGVLRLHTRLGTALAGKAVTVNSPHSTPSCQIRVV